MDTTVPGFEDRNGSSFRRIGWKSTLENCISPLLTKDFLKILLGGQFVSLLICGTAVTSQILQEEHSISAPTTQSFMNYLLLTLVYAGILCFRKDGDNFYHIFMKRGWKYLIVAVIDVEANYLVVKAYQYTTLTSIQMLDCITIPVVLGLSFIILNTRYRWTHIVGILICMVGLVGLVVSDVLTGRSAHGEPSNRLLGDMLCLIGASLYGFSNVAEEYAVRCYTRVEFLGMVGLFATFISGIQLIILERQELATFSWNLQSVFLLIAFAVFMFSLYSLFPLVIKWSSAAVVNLSILTADLYSLLFGLWLFHFKFSALYLVAYFIIMGGILCYGLRPTYTSETGISYNFFKNSGDGEVSTQDADRQQIILESEKGPDELHVLATDKFSVTNS